MQAALTIPPTPIGYASLVEVQLWARSIMESRAHDFRIGPEDDPYMLRWWVIPRGVGPCVYLHKILRSDDDRAGHDHPWNNHTYVIEGGYDEVIYNPAAPWRPIDTITRTPGDIVSRAATDTHRLIVPDGGYAISLFVTGPKVRDWGFWCPSKRWVDWRDFTGGENGELVGRGCEAA